MILLALLTIVSAGLLYRLLKSSGIHRHGRRLARPSDTIPLIGNAIRFLQAHHVQFNWFIKQQQAFGGDTYEISAPWLPAAVVISRPENIEFVLKNESRIPRGDFFTARTLDLFGYGIINATGSLARVQREVALSFFAGENIDALITTVLPDVYSSTTRATLAHHAQTNKPLDLQRTLLDLTTEVISTMVYDSAAISVSSRFSEALDYASDWIGRRFQKPLYPLTELFTGAKFRAAVEEVKVTGVKILHRARKRRAREAFASLCDNTEPQFDSLIDLLIDTLGSSNPTTLVADSALNFLYAARDTTAHWLSWTVYAVVHDSDALARVLAEISTLPPPEQLQPADLDASRIPYTTAVLHEALRLYPPVPLQIRQCGGDGSNPVTLPDGTSLPPHTLVIWCVWAINRSTALWGDNAHLFRPARWLDEDRQQFQRDNKSAWEFPVFGGGTRGCVGEPMARVMTAWVLVVVLREFSIEEETVSENGNGNGNGRIASSG
ncbi:hypothetical protein DV736_g2455, partial [Chaetothyriales sp. CBS 134916]